MLLFAVLATCVLRCAVLCAGQDHQEDRAEDAVPGVQTDVHEGPQGEAAGARAQVATRPWRGWLEGGEGGGRLAGVGRAAERGIERAGPGGGGLGLAGLGWATLGWAAGRSRLAPLGKVCRQRGVVCWIHPVGLCLSVVCVQQLQPSLLLPHQPACLGAGRHGKGAPGWCADVLGEVKPSAGTPGGEAGSHLLLLGCHWGAPHHVAWPPELCPCGVQGS